MSDRLYRLTIVRNKIFDVKIHHIRKLQVEIEGKLFIKEIFKLVCIEKEVTLKGRKIKYYTDILSSILKIYTIQMLAGSVVMDLTSMVFLLNKKGDYSPKQEKYCGLVSITEKLS